MPKITKTRQIKKESFNIQVQLIVRAGRRVHTAAANGNRYETWYDISDVEMILLL